MTIDEKVGQLFLYFGPDDPWAQIKNGLVTGIFHVVSANRTRALQAAAKDSRLGIPLLFVDEVVHGFRTTFPIGIAMAASWDISAIENAARVAAIEARASGVTWTFAPVVDVVRDARWGSVDSSSEDPYLVARIGEANLRGFQNAPTPLLACAKHYVAYGAPEGGLDYYSAEMSDRTLFQIYMPPFKAAVDAGVGCVMASFIDIAGVPIHSSRYLLRDTLKRRFGFRGFVVSEFGAVRDLIDFRVASNLTEAAGLALNAGVDVDLGGPAYPTQLAKAVSLGLVNQSLVDDAVRRVLRKKFELGLFDDPFAAINETLEQSFLHNAHHRELARDSARKSIVLLQNKQNLLPLSRSARIAAIGPLVKASADLLGSWRTYFEGIFPFATLVGKYPSAFENDKIQIETILQEIDKSTTLSGHPPIVTLYSGLMNATGDSLNYSRGCDILSNDTSGFAEAINVANQSDVAVLGVGEAHWMSGQLGSRTSLRLPGLQENLINAIAALNKPIVLVVMAGRPLILTDFVDKVQAIVYAWYPGIEAGNAIADVLFGDYNPSAKLPITFPRAVGQIPIYYAKRNVGRQQFLAYQDLSTRPLFPFGFGLSYTTFEYSNLTLSRSTMASINDSVTVSLLVRNNGTRKGTEIVQLYVRKLVASVSLPQKELKGFALVTLNPGETRPVSILLHAHQLAFVSVNIVWQIESGEFELQVSAASDDVCLSTHMSITFTSTFIDAPLEEELNLGSQYNGNASFRAHPKALSLNFVLIGMLLIFFYKSPF